MPVDAGGDLTLNGFQTQDYSNFGRRYLSVLFSLGGNRRSNCAVSPSAYCCSVREGAKAR